MKARSGTRPQRGGFVIGFVVGLLAGLVVALAVALYVTKVPVPFVNKVPQRTAEQDAAEAERNKSWDPNSGLVGRPAKPGAASAPPPAAAVPPALPGTPPVVTVTAPPAASAPARDPAAILEGRPPNLSAAAGADPFIYFVQAGAYSRAEDAEQQRARLGLLGVEAKLSEREQGGRTMYRVRVGPFERKEEAEAAKEKLAGGGVDAALVRVQK